MSDSRSPPLRTSASLREKRLAALLEGRDAADPRLREAVEDAQVLGSLELSGLAATAEDVRAARRGGEAPPHVAGMVLALRAVDPAEPLSVHALLAWHAALAGGAPGLRATERQRPEGPGPAPARFIQGRLELLEQWMAMDSGRELRPAQQGALALARIVEIMPFEEGNGRVARLAASHLMVRAGARPPVLTGADAGAYQRALSLAHQLHTEPLCALLEQASDRALDVLIQALEALPR